MSSAPRIAIDIGGTFTDAVLQVGTSRYTAKVLTTTRNPAEGFMQGISQLLSKSGVSPSDVALITHGTTLATNALIERRGANTALIATEGHRDSLEIGYENRFDQYNFDADRNPPLVPRSRRWTVAERIDCRGNVLTPLDENSVERLIKPLREAKIESVAVGLLHAYANPTHEQRIRDILKTHLPDLSICLSSEVCPEIREYERQSTTCANAYVQPLMASYLIEVRERLAHEGFRCACLLMTSGGHQVTIDTAAAFPVRLVESGPAGGAILAAHIAETLGEGSVLSFDMGGTTAKMCLIENAEPEHANTFEAGRVRRFRQGSGIPLKVPVIDLIEIGAGGGSIARLDAMGLLKVGPDSASSEPGPVCYGLGGQEPTVTDADLLLGYLSPDYFLGGEMALNTDVVKDAIDQHLASPSGIDITAAAAGIHAIVNNNMAAATRRYIAEKGRDPRRYTLVATGGAGPVHAYGVAKQLKLKRVICPLGAGVSSALGFLVAAPATEGVKSYVSRLDQLDIDKVKNLYEEMSRAAIKSLVEAGGNENTITIKHRVEMRYVGQGFEIAVDLPDEWESSNLAELLLEEFLQRYAELFGRSISDVAIETVSWRISASGPTPNIQLNFEGQQIDRGAVEKGERQVFFPETGYAPCKIYNRYGLEAGTSFAGPAVIEERESTVVAGPDTTISVDDHLNLIIDIDYPQDKD